MNCGLVIVARLGSQRLRAKHLQLVGDTPILRCLILRIHHAFCDLMDCGQAHIVIATSDEPENRALEEVAGAEASVFYGSIQNIPLRQRQAADHFGFEHLVSVDGDDILCSPSGMRAVAGLLEQGAGYAKTAGLPFGMNSFGYTRRFLGEALGRHQAKTLETGWGRIFQGHSPAVATYSHLPQDERLRFTLDYGDDLTFFRAVIGALGARAAVATDEEIVQLVLQRRLYELNGALATEYWNNFRSQLQNESSST